jgi:Flp pilus assembly protein TadG
MTMPARMWRSDRGSAIVELALTLPILVLVVAAGVDFARVFYVGMALQNAARAGAQWGSHAAAQTGNTALMQTTALNAYANTNITGATATASRMCECATDTGTFSATSPANTCTASACSSGHLVVTVTVSVSAPFTRIMPGVPGLPASMTLTRTAKMRAVP